MNLLQQILTRNNLERPDGRPLFAYEATTDEMLRLTKLLRLRIESGQRLTSTAQAFVLWSAERIRTDFSGGKLSWDFVYEGLELPPKELALTYWLVEHGLRKWGRIVRQFSHGRRAFLYTLLAEGGLPDAALREAGSYRSVLLSFLAELESEGAHASTVARAVARRHVSRLPQALRNPEQEELLGELVLTLIELRQALPESWPQASAISWLDSNRPGWRTELPLRLSVEALESIVRPALTVERPRAAKAPVQRELRRNAVGVWYGAARVIEGAQIPNATVAAAQGKRLRLISDTGAAYIGQPEPGGWRILRSAGSATLPVAPQDSLILTAYVDGHKLGRLVLDPGLSSPDERPTLWRPEDPLAGSPEVLLPLSGRGQSCAQMIWVLVQSGVEPQPEDGLSIGSPEQGPNACLWPVKGQGRLRVGPVTLALRTGAEADSPVPRLMLTGVLLKGTSHPRGIPVYVGFPQIWGSEGERPLRQLKGKSIRRREQSRLLCGELVEWVEDNVILAQVRMVTLPVGADLSFIEIANGQLHFLAEGLVPGWSVIISAGDADATGFVDTNGNVELKLGVQNLPGLVNLRIWEPKTGKALELSAIWPARQPRLIAPDGQTLSEDRQISHQALAGWRGYLPGRGGAVLIRLANDGKAVGFAAQGEVAFASLKALIGQALALTGADGRVNLRLACGGAETRRLSIGRFDWGCEGRGLLREFGQGRTRLVAVSLHERSETFRIEVAGNVNLIDWLGEGEGLWFIQGENDDRGLMRPFVWSNKALDSSTREERIDLQAARWADFLQQPADASWDRAWALIAEVRAAGDAGALDQVQALARMPAAAVALLMTAPKNDRASALALEAEAPIWWPLVSIQDWAVGVSGAHQHLRHKLDAAGLSSGEASSIAQEAMTHAASEIVTLRPELAAHIGHALLALGLSPEARDAMGNVTHLLPPADIARLFLNEAAQDAGRRFEELPDGVGNLYAQRLHAPDGCNEANAPLFHAPLVAAEAAVGLRPALEGQDILCLIALREADAVWFDQALPASITIALSQSEVSQ